MPKVKNIVIGTEKIRAGEILKRFVFKIKITGMWRSKIRIRMMVLIIRFAAFVGGVHIEIEQEYMEENGRYF